MYVGGAIFSGSSTGSGGTLKFDAGSTGPITVVNSNDAVIAQPGSGNWIQSTVDYTLPANVDTLFLFGTQGTGNSDASGDALYAVNPGIGQTLTGNTANDAFVVYSTSDVVIPKAGSHDVVYAAASYTLADRDRRADPGSRHPGCRQQRLQQAMRSMRRTRARRRR